MVAQPHHLKPHHKTPPQNPPQNPPTKPHLKPHLKPRQKTPPKNPTKKPHQKTPPKIIIHDPTIIAYLRHAIVWGGYSLPHTAGTSGTACVGLTIIACLRHAARSTRHLTAPLLATATTPTTNSRPPYPLPLTSYPLPPPNTKKGAAPCGTAPYTHVDS